MSLKFFSQETKITLCNTKTSIYWRKPKTSSQSKFFFFIKNIFLIFLKSGFEGKKHVYRLFIYSTFLLFVFLPNFFFHFFYISFFFYIVRLFNGLNGSLVTASLNNFFFFWIFLEYFFLFETDLESFFEDPEHQVFTTKKAKSCFSASRQIILKNTLFYFCRIIIDCNL